MNHRRTRHLLTLILVAIFLVGCSAPPPTPTLIQATLTSVPPTATFIPPTVTAIPPPPATALPDFILPGARAKYSFDQIIPLLSSPQLVSQFMRNNVKRDGDYDLKVCGGNCYYPASLVYQNGVDDSDGHAILQCYILEKNGWDAYMIGLAIDTPVGHNICGVNINQTVLVLDDEGRIEGPFKSLAEVARFYINRGEMKDGASLRSIKASQITQITTDGTKPSVLGLPWAIHPY